MPLYMMREIARKVAKRVGAEHLEVEFSEDDFWRFAASCRRRRRPHCGLRNLAHMKLAREGAGVKVVLCAKEATSSLPIRPMPITPAGGKAGGRYVRKAFWMVSVYCVSSRKLARFLDTAQATATFPHRTRLQIAQATDCADWLPNDFTHKTRSLLDDMGSKDARHSLTAKWQKSPFPCRTK